MFTDVLQHLHPGDVLVRNNTRVIPARLIGHRPETGGTMEFLLLSRLEGDTWECLCKPAKRAKVGTVYEVTPELSVKVLGDAPMDGGKWVELLYDGIFEEVLDRAGQMPLPPYITERLADKERYQTVYAVTRGSAAAPTAGLHFTPELEFYRVTEEAAKAINDARAAGGRIVCVGTTSVRTLESVATEDGIVHPGSGYTGIYITPGYRYKAVDALITNFHLPESTLLMLVSAFAGREEVLRVYAHAVEERYRFFSFGDACLFE